LLFDLGRVVLDIDFNKTLSCWAGHAGCEPAQLVTRFVRDEIYHRHETGEISDAAYFAAASFITWHRTHRRPVPRRVE
jgi:hypothetical protein